MKRICCIYRDFRAYDVPLSYGRKEGPRVKAGRLEGKEIRKEGGRDGKSNPGFTEQRRAVCFNPSTYDIYIPGGFGGKIRV